VTSEPRSGRSDIRKVRQNQEISFCIAKLSERPTHGKKKDKKPSAERIKEIIGTVRRIDRLPAGGILTPDERKKPAQRAGQSNPRWIGGGKRRLWR
jgi:hypothetical protein